MRKYPQCSGCFASSLSSTFSLTGIKSPRFPLFFINTPVLFNTQRLATITYLEIIIKICFLLLLFITITTRNRELPSHFSLLDYCPLRISHPFFLLHFLSLHNFQDLPLCLWDSGSVIRTIYYISTTSLNYLAFLLYLKLDC